MEEVLIFPFSGTAIEALDCLGENQVCVGFISDNEELKGTKQYGVEIFSRDVLDRIPLAKVLAVNGSPASFLQRKTIIDSLGINEGRFTSVIHRKAVLGRNVVIGFNVLIMAGVVITANAIIGNHICILPNSVIHHDSIIGDYTLIAAKSTICGNVTIGNNCYIGAASSIKNGLSIGQNTLVGIGSNLIRSVGENTIIKGNPAKV